jgi:glutathione S-transferase
MIKIWGRKLSSNVQAVLWCLAELDLDHSRIDAGCVIDIKRIQLVHRDRYYDLLSQRLPLQKRVLYQ